MNTLAKSSLFWDVDIHTLDKHLHSDFIVSRIFSFGDEDDVRWMTENYSPQYLKEVFERHSGNVDERSKNYWILFFQFHHSLCIAKLSTTQHSAFSKR